MTKSKEYINAERPTRNIRKPGDVGNFNFCTFNKNCSGLTSWSSEIPASAYCHPLCLIQKKKQNEKDFYNNINVCVWICSRTNDR